MHKVLAALLLAAALAGCGGPPHPSTTATVPPVPAPVLYEVRCALQDASGTPLAGTCRYDFPGYQSTAATRNGTAVLRIAKGLSGTLAANAPDHMPNQVTLLVDGPKSVRFTLARAGGEAVAPDVSPLPDSGSSGPGTPTAPPVQHAPLVPRHWLAPVVVDGNGSGDEPALAVAADGTVYYAPLSSLYRGDPAGNSTAFTDVTPRFPQGGLAASSDTAVSLAPDGTVWFTDDWPYAGETQGCTSASRGQAWTCDLAALPGATDRMWIAGLSSTEGYLETSQGLQQPNWLHTTTGSQAYTPFAVGTTGQKGPMAYDAKAKAVYQVEGGATLGLARIDTASGLVAFQDTGVPGTLAIPWLAAYDGVLWVTGEKDGKVLAAHSGDGGKTWASTQVSTAPKQVAFSYVAAGPHGRVAVVYLGSDKAGPATSNGGTWSLYLAETEEGLAAAPAWVESRVVEGVHKGSLCIGIGCDSTGPDPRARVEGDLIGIALDADGNAHLGYVQDNGATAAATYLRQALG